MIYRLARPALFALEAERSHDMTMAALSSKLAPAVIRGLLGSPVDDPVSLCGLPLGNRVGLAAGLDKNARAIDAFAAMGFGFLEVGTVTPRAQPGNAKPRLFRLQHSEALINRFGFNNDGVAALRTRVEQRQWAGVLGINIGKNADTPAENAVDDYVSCLHAVAACADYITINVSSPNTKNLRDLQSDEALQALLQALTRARSEAADQHQRRLPLLLKVAPDMDDEQRGKIAEAVTRFDIDGVIASNTTTDRQAVAGHQHAAEAGGLSGAPLRDRTPHIISTWRALLGPEKALVAAGGIASGTDAITAIAAGADAVQIYTGLIYEGPGLVRSIAKTLKAHKGT